MRPGNRVEFAAPVVQTTLPSGLPLQRGASVAAHSVPKSFHDAPPGRVLLIDPDITSAQQLAQTLSDAGMATVRTVRAFDPATDSGAGPRSADDSQTADLAVVSLRLGSEAVGTIRRLRDTGWRRVIAMSSTATIGEITDAFEAGATGTIVVGRSAPARDVPTGIFDLSPREVEVIRMVADGRSNKWIGEHLELSALTVKSHLARIGRKLGTGDRAHMVALSLRAGIIS